MSALEIRSLDIGDAAEVAAIYARHVLTGTATFEEVPPTTREMAGRIEAILGRNYPALAAVDEGKIVGYAFAGAHKERSAYRYTVEDSIYLEPVCQGQGIGSALLSQLIELCAARGFRQIMAVIGDSGNAASIKLHRRLGFGRIGIARGIGFKFGQALDVVYMQRQLTD